MSAQQEVYRNPLVCAEDLQGWVAEGPVGTAHVGGGTELFSTADLEALEAAGRGDHAHVTFWCPEVFAADVEIAWDVRPLVGRGLAMLFFAATGTRGRDLFDPALPARTGYYPQYHSGEVSTLHVSYLRAKWPSERRFRTCNLRRSPGFRLVAQGADPLPDAVDADGWYRVRVRKDGPEVSFFVDDLELFRWHDPEPLGPGRIGFRQMAPLRARYRDLEVTPLS